MFILQTLANKQVDWETLIKRSHAFIIIAIISTHVVILIRFCAHHGQNICLDNSFCLIFFQTAWLFTSPCVNQWVISWHYWTVIGSTNNQAHTLLQTHLFLADEWSSMNLNTQTHHFFRSVLITSPNRFFFLILVVSSGNQNTLATLPGSWETACCMRAADAYYWFTLWPRKQLIAYAEAAWHLTIRYGERDD